MYLFTFGGLQFRVIVKITELMGAASDREVGAPSPLVVPLALTVHQVLLVVIATAFPYKHTCVGPLFHGKTLHRKKKSFIHYCV